MTKLRYQLILKDSETGKEIFIDDFSDDWYNPDDDLDDEVKKVSMVEIGDMIKMYIDEGMERRT